MILLFGLFIPFAGTVAGAAAVFLMRRGRGTAAAATDGTEAPLPRTMTGFAAGVMTAAAVWSLLLPAIEISRGTIRPGWLPAAAGVALGVLFLLLLDNAVPHQHASSDRPEGPSLPSLRLGRTAKLTLAVTIHNIPEGMAVGAVLAAHIAGQTGISTAAVMAISLGIALQNIPEGAIVSLPMLAAGNSRRRSFAWGVLSGAVEPAAGALTVLLAAALVPVLPWLLAFAAGAMLYVVVDELIPEAQRGLHSDRATVGFAAGFILMMVLDVATG